jgi:transcriptional regulator with GAF, ATPase, and Fis domain
MARHLTATAGTILGSTTHAPAEPSGTGHLLSPEAPHKRMPRVDGEWRQRIEEALRANAGNVAATARALGLHRTQLRRLLERHGLSVDAVADADDGAVD